MPFAIFCLGVHQKHLANQQAAYCMQTNQYQICSISSRGLQKSYTTEREELSLDLGHQLFDMFCHNKHVMYWQTVHAFYCSIRQTKLKYGEFFARLPRGSWNRFRSIKIISFNFVNSRHKLSYRNSIFILKGDEIKPKIGGTHH